MPTLPFIKATACGNDFLIINAAACSGDVHSLTRTICDRHKGVGADGVEWTMSADGADVRIRLVNADGSDAEISGNGTRCVAAWYYSEHPKNRVLIQTDAGLKSCEFTARKGNTYEFRTTMGEPMVEPELTIELMEGEAKGVPISMGNPHYVMLVDQFAPDWQRNAAEIATHSNFPQGTNVELVRVLSEHEIELRIWERGVGETLSSGTGSSSSAVAAIYSGRAKSPVRVITPGGVQKVEWNKEVFLSGPATLLCRGEFFI